MFELPKFTPIEDNTGSLLLKAAEQASEQQRSFANLIQKNEQIRQESFGGAQKQLMDIATAKGLPVEVQRQLLQNGLSELTAMFKDRANVKNSDLTMRAADIVSKAKLTSSAYQNYIDSGNKVIADLKEQGWDDVNLMSALSNSVFEEKQVNTPTGPAVVRVPKAIEQLGDPIEYLTNQIEIDPKKYLNHSKAEKEFNSMVNSLKPAKLDITDKQDVTGNRTIVTAYSIEKYPFTRTEEVEQNGQKLQVNVLDTIPDPNISSKLGVDAMVLSPNAFKFFANHPSAAIRGKVISGGLEYIDAHNKNLGVDPNKLTPENIEEVMANIQGVINPFDEQNRVIFSNLALTEKLTPQFGRFGKLSVTDDRAKQSVVRVSGGGGSSSDGLTEKDGDIKSDAIYAVNARKILDQDQDVIKTADAAAINYKGKTIVGPRVSDIAMGQLFKSNGKKVVAVVEPGVKGVVYIAELDDDGEVTDKVERLEGEDAKAWFKRNASANTGGRFDKFDSQFEKAGSKVTPASEDVIIAKKAEGQEATRIAAGSSFIANSKVYKSLEEGKSKSLGTTAVVMLDGKPTAIKSVRKEKLPIYRAFGTPKFYITTEGNKEYTFDSAEDFFSRISKVD